MKAKRRFEDHKPVGNPLVLEAHHPAVVNARTYFGARRKHPDLVLRVLKSGEHSRKIGSHCVKGAWRGMPIYTLTLEERATCPRSCKHWADCYGNKMNWSERLEHGRALEERICYELWELQQKRPRGFIVRLHVLGDFYSVAYVDMWKRALELLPALRVFGYTAWQLDTEIGAAVARLRAAQWDRFAVRTSDAPEGIGPRTVSGEAVGAITCPAQTGATACCGTCALCWSTKKPIAFLVH